MSQAGVTRSRYCNVCGRWFYMAAKELKEHVIFCKRVKNIGLVVAGGIITPEIPRLDFENDYDR